MKIAEIRKRKADIAQIADKYHIHKVFIFGLVARGESREGSDVDFLIELAEDASALGVGGFQHEAHQLLGLAIDVIPAFALHTVSDREFVEMVQTEAMAL